MESTTYTSWQLAKLAEVSDPDAHDGIGFDGDVVAVEGSPGAKFLRSVAHSVEEYVNDETDDQDADDRASEIADSAVPVYTHELWATFVDLAAYNEDVEQFGSGDTDDPMNRSASLALYTIAERLARALIEAEKSDDDDDD